MKNARSRWAAVFNYWWLWCLLMLALAVVLPNISGASRCLQVHKAQADLGAYAQALEQFRAVSGDYPSTSEGLWALVPKQLSRVSRDPWGNPYIYQRENPPRAPLVYSPGRDGIDSRGCGDDVTSLPKDYRCEDYGVDCPPGPTQILAWVLLAITVPIVFVGIKRSAKRQFSRWR